MKIHNLKTHTDVFLDVAIGAKKFEIRKDDRNFHTGDILNLEKFNPETEKYEYGYVLAKVDYILVGGQFGIQKGYVAMSITVLS